MPEKVATNKVRPHHEPRVGTLPGPHTTMFAKDLGRSLQLPHYVRPRGQGRGSPPFLGMYEDPPQPPRSSNPPPHSPMLYYQVMVECEVVEGGQTDLTGDVGAVGRWTVSESKDITLDLKGVMYSATIAPSNTMMIINVGEKEAKVESLFSDYIQLREQANIYQTENTLAGNLCAPSLPCVPSAMGLLQ